MFPTKTEFEACVVTRDEYYDAVIYKLVNNVITEAVEYDLHFSDWDSAYKFVTICKMQMDAKNAVLPVSIFNVKHSRLRVV